MKALLTSIIASLFLSVNLTFGQTTNYVLTQEQSKVWLDSLMNMTTDKQLIYIKNRILQDTIVYNSNQLRSDRLIIGNIRKEERLKKHGIISGGRIMYFIKPKRKYNKILEFRWNNWTNTRDIKNFHQFLSYNKISSITFFNESNSVLLFGHNAKFGVIIFELKHNKNFRGFKKQFISK